MFLSVNGISLYYEVIGSGDPLIMMHGNGETHEVFTEAADVLKDYFTVYLVDTRGHGQSTKCPEYHYQDMADDIKGMMEALQLKNATFYGFSDGGIIGLLLASQTNLFQQYIVSGANSIYTAVPLSCKIWERVTYLLHRNPLIKLMIDEPNIPAEELKKITTEVDILAGSKDIILEKHTRYLHDTIPGSKLEILPDRTHGSYIVHNTEIADLILKYTGKKTT